MPEPSAKSKEKQKLPFFSRLQVKYALSYLALLAVVLVLLNTYPLIASQNLLISSKEDSLRSQIAVMSSALMELETLAADQVARVMNMLDNMGLERIWSPTLGADPVRQPHPGAVGGGGGLLRTGPAGRRRRLRPADLSVRPVSGGGPGPPGERRALHQL